YAQDTQVRFPLMKSIQRIVIRTQIFGKRRCASNRLLEHPTKRQTIDDSGLNSKSDDPARVLVHDYEYPIGSPCDGFASHKIRPPEKKAAAWGTPRRKYT